jgi:hypothetical protein
MKIINLFELTFIDNTKIWASVYSINGITKIETICFGTLGKGLNLEIKKLFEKDKKIVCYVANEFSKNKSLVKKYIDFAELESIKIKNQLIKYKN